MTVYDPEYAHQRYLADRERILALNKEWKRNNRELANETRRKWRKRNQRKEKAQQQRDNEKRRLSGYFKEYDAKRYASNSEEIKARRRAYYHANRGRERDYNRIYCSKNRSRISAQRKERRRSDINYRIAEKLRATLLKVMLRRNTHKAASAFELLGCTVASFTSHLESLFQPGMTWDNYGRFWHVDHHVPIKAFELENPEHQKWCFYWKNLQPMTQADNYLKRDKLPTPLPPWLPPHIAERINHRKNHDQTQEIKS